MKKIISGFFAALFLAACGANYGASDGGAPTPTVDYVRNMDPFGGGHKDAFLSQLAMNYRSFAIYNADVSGYGDIGELFAQKAVSAFSGETPMPESMDNWNIEDKDISFDLRNANQDLMKELQNDASIDKPTLAAEAQAKFDCWLSSEASGQIPTADECHKRFSAAIAALRGNGVIVDQSNTARGAGDAVAAGSGFVDANDYPSTDELGLLTDTKRVRDGFVIVNNINVPQNLIRPAPVHPVVFNQNIYSDRIGIDGCVDEEECGSGARPLGDELVSRDEFINMMMALRNEIQAINGRLANAPAPSAAAPMASTATIKVQQIPTEPKQRVMEEIFEVKFDFNKSEIKKEYASVIAKLASAARENKNVKISVVGHTDTVGSDSYNYALGGRRAESVKKMLIEQGIPASSIIVVSSGKNDLKIATGKGVKNADNRRVQVVKEVRYLEPATAAPAVEIIETTGDVKIENVEIEADAAALVEEDLGPAIVPAADEAVGMPEPLVEDGAVWEEPVAESAD
ncbi:MAG: OmpA family protein [Rickettsiales bacterium]|jgi:outer membrane protein OmpA-like peptidoglycan-associated protein|nr:OmpA family protein [Rickettsiales bacterium]